MLYHIDNTPEMPSDRFGTTGYDKRYQQDGTVKKEFTDPVDTTDRAYINYGLKIGIELCYWEWNKIYGSKNNYYAGTKERIMGDWFSEMYYRAKEGGELYKEKNIQGKNLVVKIGDTYFNCKPTKVSCNDEVDMVWDSGLPMGFFLGITFGFIVSAVLYFVM